MQIDSLMSALNNSYEGLLNAIESKFWGKSKCPDVTTEPFYVFKHFPTSLKAEQRKEWAKVQTKISSPYKQGDIYSFLTNKGVAIWCSPNPFSGVPETALQNKMPDGTHFVHGCSYCYQQVWLDGTMTKCKRVSKEHLKEHVVSISLQNSWASERQVDQYMRSPLLYGALAISVLFLSFAWELGKWVSVESDRSMLSERSTLLEAEVGDKLNIQASLKSANNVVVALNSWRSSYGQLPQTLANTIEHVTEFTSWQADSIEWQNNTLSLQLVLPNVDIPKLVEELERSPKIVSVAVRPHSKSDTWILEVSGV